MVHTNWGFRDFPTQEGQQAFSPSPCLQRQQTHKRFRALERGWMHPTRPSEWPPPMAHLLPWLPKGMLKLPSYMDLGCHATQKLSSYPFKGHQYGADQKIILFMPFFWQLHSLALLRYASALGKSPGIKHHGTMEYWKWWHEYPISNILTSFVFFAGHLHTYNQKL